MGDSTNIPSPWCEIWPGHIPGSPWGDTLGCVGPYKMLLTGCLSSVCDPDNCVRDENLDTEHNLGSIHDILCLTLSKSSVTTMRGRYKNRKHGFQKGAWNKRSNRSTYKNKNSDEGPPDKFVRLSEDQFSELVEQSCNGTLQAVAADGQWATLRLLRPRAQCSSEAGV